jgi:hypothetical protein
VRRRHHETGQQQRADAKATTASTTTSVGSDDHGDIDGDGGDDAADTKRLPALPMAAAKCGFGAGMPNRRSVHVQVGSNREAELAKELDELRGQCRDLQQRTIAREKALGGELDWKRDGTQNRRVVIASATAGDRVATVAPWKGLAPEMVRSSPRPPGAGSARTLTVRSAPSRRIRTGTCSPGRREPNW